MQHRPLLGDVDLLAAEHRIGALAQLRFFGQGEQQLDRLVGDAVLRVVEEQAHSLRRQTLTALWVVGEEGAQMYLGDFARVRLQVLPRLQAGQWLYLDLGLAAFFVVAISILQFTASQTSARYSLPTCLGSSRRTQSFGCETCKVDRYRFLYSPNFTLSSLRARVPVDGN